MSITYKDLIRLGLFPLFVYTLNSAFLFWAPDFYKLYSVDTPMHFLGGVSIAYGACYVLFLFEKRGWIKIQKDLLKVFIITSAVTTVAVWWEFYEFLNDQFYGTSWQPSVSDTIKDLYMGMIGALIFCLLTLHKKNKR